MNEEALFKKFFSPRPDDLGDHGLLGGGLGALQALQVPPDLLHHLLQLHDPRPLRGAAQVLINETYFCLIFFIIFQGRHQASICDQFTLQVRQMVRLGTHDGSLLII